MTNCIYYNEESFVMVMRPFCMRVKGKKGFIVIEHVSKWSGNKYKGIKCPCKHYEKNK